MFSAAFFIHFLIIGSHFTTRYISSNKNLFRLFDGFFLVDLALFLFVLL